MQANRYLIIGAGQAGCKAAKTLRSVAPDGDITLVGDEPHAPYERPQLSKGVLAGTTEVEQLFIAQPEYFDEAGITLLTASPASALDPRVKEVTLADGRCLRYDKLLLTTGSQERVLRIPGSHLDGVHYLRTLDQALMLRRHLSTASNLVVIGAGFIGLEVAANAGQHANCTVTVVETAEDLLQRGAPQEMRDAIRQLHGDRGTTFRFGKTVASLKGDGHVQGVVCQDGEILAADCVLICIGIEPRVSLASQAGLAVQNGIVVNQNCETSTRDIYAAGEVTSHWNAQLEAFMRLESWQTAELQPICAARNMAGENVQYNQIPWFWTDQYDANIQLVGVLTSGEEVVQRRYSDTKFVYFYFKNGKLLGAFAFNSGKDIRATQKMLEKGIGVGPEQFADPGVDLRKLLKSAST